MVILTSKKTTILDVYSSFGYDANCRGGVAKNIENNFTTLLLSMMMMIMMTNTGEDNKIEREWLWKKKTVKYQNLQEKYSYSANKYIANEKCNN